MCWFCRKKTKVEPTQPTENPGGLALKLEFIEQSPINNHRSKLGGQKSILKSHSPVSAFPRIIMKFPEQSKSYTAEDTVGQSCNHSGQTVIGPVAERELRMPISAFGSTAQRQVSDPKMANRLGQDSGLSIHEEKQGSSRTLNLTYDNNCSRVSRDEDRGVRPAEKANEQVILMSPIKMTKPGRQAQGFEDLEQSRGANGLYGRGQANDLYRKDEANDSAGSIDNSDLAVANRSPKNMGRPIQGDFGVLIPRRAKPEMEKQLTQQSGNTRVRSRGYRTLKYSNILDNRKENVSPQRMEDSKNHLSTFFNITSGANRNGSLLVCEQDEINKLDKNNLSAMDFSIDQSRMQPCRSRSVRSQTRVESRRLTRRGHSRSINQGSAQDGDGCEVRENKDLNTTYIRSSETLAAKHASRDLGFKLSGMRTKINQYVTVKSLGKGSWGEVYLVVDINSKTKYVGFV